MKRLKICKTLTGTPQKIRLKLSTPELIEKLIGVNPNLCPACGSDKLRHCQLLDNTS